MSHDYEGRTVRITCLHCGVTYSYKQENADAEGYYRCQNCNSRIGFGGIQIVAEPSQGGSPGRAVTTERIDGVSIKCPKCGATYV